MPRESGSAAGECPGPRSGEVAIILGAAEGDLGALGHHDARCLRARRRRRKVEIVTRTVTALGKGGRAFVGPTWAA